MNKKEGLKTGTAQYQKKVSLLEDAYNSRWQAIISFGCWLIADEIRLAGWYHSVMTIGPDPKPIGTCMTIHHQLCVTYGPLRTYKVFVKAYRGRIDEDLEVRHNNTANL